MSDATESSSLHLFKDVTYYLVGNIEKKVIDLLNDGRAKQDTYLSEMVSHVIADDCTQSEYSEAKELFELPVVSSNWVRLSVKCGKQLPIKFFSPEDLIFSGVVASCSKLDNDDTKAIWAMLTTNGGKCQKTLDKYSTHLITPEKDGVKYEKAMKCEGSIKVVCPDWITASLEKGERQDETLYHPGLLRTSDQATPPSSPLPQQTTTTEETPPKQENTEVTAKQQAKLQLKAQALQQHGRIHQKQDIGMTRSPANQVIAQQLAAAVLEKRLANEDSRSRTSATPNAKQALALMVSNRLQGSRPRNKSPGRPALGQIRSPYSVPPPVQPSPHLPVPAGMPPMGMPPGLPPFVPHSMPHQLETRPLRNITNRADHPSTSLPGVMPEQSKMNEKLGTGHLMRPNTRPPPPRYMPSSSATQNVQPRFMLGVPPTYWGHDPTDNLPAEMCLLGCVFYITDYLKIVGQQQIDNWKKVIEQHGGQVDPAYSNRVTHLLCATQHSDVFHIALKDQRRVVTAFWLNDVLVKKKMLPPWQALHLPIIYGENKPCSNQILCVTNFDGEERLRVKQMISAIGAKYTGYMTHGNSAVICGRPEGKKYEKAKEWRIPVVNVHWLSDLVLGHLDALRIPVQNKYSMLGQDNQFHLDVMKVIHLMVGWQAPLKIQKETWKKFMPNHKSKINPMSGQENENVRDTKLEPVIKKQKLENEESVFPSNPNRPAVLFTGFPKGLVKKLQMIVTQLGGTITENPKHCTHLVTPSLSRTMKFFIAINVCKHVVTKEWLETSLSQGSFVDETAFILKDTASEKAMDCCLSESLKRAHLKPLFQGLSFYISPSVMPPSYDLEKIVEVAGGRVLKRRPALKTFLEQRDKNGQTKIVMITCENDVVLYKDLIAKNVAIYNAEFVLTGVMRQTVDFKSFQIDIH